MTARTLAQQVLDRGKSMSARQYSWFRSMAENDSTISVEWQGNYPCCYFYLTDGRMVSVEQSYQTYGGARLSISSSVIADAAEIAAAVAAA
ncbi:hypothetical protein UFOVP1122_15 [uncultured Caudovirales phage]|uniref:Uncharacterized protein n=1 Tax=uncultured Caudovirales phage TaxID=2100421 RepID=A0A6J5QLF4_9CAUD|nr:hypothetical protein UFOVP1122_15 [uncultured Caudovirales phage]